MSLARLVLMRWTVALWGILCATVGFGHAGAQQPADSARPFVPGGVYDKPYLTTLLGRTSVGGYAEGHARWARVDGVTEELGFVARRFNLFTATRVSDFVRIAAELEVEDGGEEITLELAAIDVILHPAAILRGGMILVPLGRWSSVPRQSKRCSGMKKSSFQTLISTAPPLIEVSAFRHRCSRLFLSARGWPAGRPTLSNSAPIIG
jgi:hypothetical protein